MAEILNGWMEFRVWGWLGSCRKYGRLTPLPVKPELMAHQPMGGKGGPERERGADWISNWMEPKSLVVGKTRSGRPDWGFTILHPEDLHSDRGRVGAKNPLSSNQAPSTQAALYPSVPLAPSKAPSSQDPSLLLRKHQANPLKRKTHGLCSFMTELGCT